MTRKRKTRLAAAPALFAEEGPSPAELKKARTAERAEEDPRLAFAREEAARWAAQQTERVRAALEAVEQRKGDLFQVYRDLYQGANSSSLSAPLRERANDALDTVAPLLAAQLRRHGWEYAKSLGTWMPRWQGEEEPAFAPMLDIDDRSPYGYLLEHPHPKLRGLRGASSCTERHARAHAILETSLDLRERMEAARALIEPCVRPRRAR